MADIQINNIQTNPKKQRTTIEDLLFNSEEFLDLSEDKLDRLVGGLRYFCPEPNSCTANCDYDY